MRTLVDIPKTDIRKLDELAGLAKRSRAAKIRAAIGCHIEESTDNGWTWRNAGHWKGRTDMGDTVEYERAMCEDLTPA